MSLLKMQTALEAMRIDPVSPIVSAYWSSRNHASLAKRWQRDIHRFFVAARAFAFVCNLHAFGVTGMMLRIPMPDTTLDFAEEVEATLVRQVPEVADQICDGCSSPVRQCPSKTATAATHAM